MQLKRTKYSNKMVHGNYYGIQYEIALNESIDFYNDLLPIWTQCRSQIKMTTCEITGKCILIVIPYSVFDEQRRSSLLFGQYMRENDNLEYDNEFKSTIIENHTQYVFYGVKRYVDFRMSHMYYGLPLEGEEYDSVAKEDFQKRKKRIIEIGYILESGREDKKTRISLSEELNSLYGSMGRSFTIQQIIFDSEYLQQIKTMHAQLLNEIKMTAEQEELVQKVLQHPTIRDKVAWHGLELTSGYW